MAINYYLDTAPNIDAGINWPYGNDAIAVTPSDTVLLQDGDGNYLKAILYVGGTGNVKVLTAYGNTITFNGVPAGSFIPCLVAQVFNTGTTATDMVAIIRR
jgi:hypothetical protein